MELYFLAAYALVWMGLIFLSRIGVIPLISENGNEIIWGLVLAPLFFLFFLVYQYFKRDEF